MEYEKKIHSLEFYNNDLFCHKNEKKKKRHESDANSIRYRRLSSKLDGDALIYVSLSISKRVYFFFFFFVY